MKPDNKAGGSWLYDLGLIPVVGSLAEAVDSAAMLSHSKSCGVRTA